MSLNVGTLSGLLELDSKPFDQGLNEIPGKASKMGGLLKTAMAAVGVAAAGALMAGISSAIDAEAATDKLAAQLGLTEAESARIGGVAGRLYADAYGSSMEEVNGAVGAVMSSIEGMATASDADLEAMTAKVLDVATAFEVDVGRAAQIAGQMVTSGLAETGEQAMDLLVASMQKVPAAVRGDLLDAMDEYGPFMAAVGVVGEEAMGLLVAAAEDGMYGIDKTGDALKEFTIRATDMSAASKVGFDAIGESQEEMAAKILAGGETAKGAFDQIVAGLLGIEDPTERANAAIALFGVPLEDLGTNEIPAFLESLQGVTGGLGDVEGAAGRMGDTLNTNASTAISTFKRTLETAFVNFLGGTVIPMVSTFATTVQDVLGPVFPALEAIAVPVLAALAAAAVLHFGAMAVAAVNAGVVHAAQVAFQVAKWVVLGAAALVSAAQIAAAWLISLGPIAIVIAAVAGVVALVIIHFDTIKDVIAGAWEFIQRNAETFIRGFLFLFTGGLSELLLCIIRNWDEIKAAVNGAITGVLLLVSGLPGKIIGALGDLDDMLYDAGKAIIKGLINGIKDMAGGVADAVGGVLSGARDLLPFSPAKKGPFSGRGWTTYSGAAMVEGIIQGIASQEGRLSNQWAGMLGGLTARADMATAGSFGAVSGGFSGGRQPMVGGVGGGTGSAAGRTPDITLNVTGATDTAAVSEEVVRTLGWAINLNGRR